MTMMLLCFLIRWTHLNGGYMKTCNLGARRCKPADDSTGGTCQALATARSLIVYGAVQAQVHRNSEQHLFRELLLGGGPS